MQIYTLSHYDLNQLEKTNAIPKTLCFYYTPPGCLHADTNTPSVSKMSNKLNKMRGGQYTSQRFHQIKMNNILHLLMSFSVLSDASFSKQSLTMSLTEADC